ncbi:uncharacterized PurR-regulated membrane protein YhhQ (DUF165 family) [Rhizomicrobium palustre]|uniref:Uncharacterized PurR-regulated membrane protein YhhQ (DUF165 family) n=1 Tax=Rhizomicrobium palustre TaxID=189966 RepID=A0A846N4A0_9PROT|nr:hypothetical protein [Rhizomicrobium palustre]NIK90041.1 uncharacterized PurR-regulated membrane protein YhhQ (DUF165 family) [Rhizomicrobium palustre]
MVQAYNRHVVPGRVGGMQMAPQDRGLYRLRAASDVPYAAAYGYGRKSGFGEKILGALAATARVAVSVGVLLAWVIGVFLYRDTPVSILGAGQGWLTLAHALVPTGFFCVFLTNRRYGPGYAFVQVLVTAIVVTGFALAAGQDIYQILGPEGVPDMREALAFGGAFILAGFVSITAFDGARGPMWWTAPLVGFLVAAFTFATIFFLASYAGADAEWFSHGATYMGILAGEGILLLIPFWALRRMVPPMSGFGGY